MGLSFYVNDKYPPEQTASAGGQRGLQTVAFTGATAAQAGPYESLIIHLVDSAFPNSIIQLAENWDSKTGLSAQQRQFLRNINPLRPQIQAVAEVKRSKRLFPNSPVASPLSGWMDQAVKLISADSETMEKIWLDALGIGAVSAAVRNSSLSVKLPRVLTAVGAPAEVNMPVPGFNIKVGGMPVYLTAKAGVVGLERTW